MVYELAALILLLETLVNYSVFLSLTKNPLFVTDTISPAIIGNLLLLACGAPCIIEAFTVLLDNNQ